MKEFVYEIIRMITTSGLREDQDPKESAPEITNEIVRRTMLDYEGNVSSYNKTRIEKIVQNAVHWSLVNGFVVVPNYLNSLDMMSVTHLPFTLFPTPFKREPYNKIWDIQPTVSDVVFNIAKSEFYMNHIFKEYEHF